MANFSRSGHPIFRASRAFEREELRSKGGRKKPISANQLSIHGAVADLCNEVPKDLWAPGKPAAPEHWEKVEIPHGPSIVENSTSAQQRRNQVQEYERTFDQLSEDQKIIQTVF